MIEWEPQGWADQPDGEPWLADVGEVHGEVFVAVDLVWHWAVFVGDNWEPTVTGQAAAREAAQQAAEEHMRRLAEA